MEFVYVVKRRDLFDLAAPHGFLPRAGHEAEIDRVLARARERGFFVERRHAEQDAELKQIIPYVVVARGRDVLLLRRSKRGGDARLHDKLSIGVGGHVNPPDAEAGGDLLAACTRRELEEELVLPAAPVLAAAGVVNDDSNAVGAVHFGVVMVARVGPGEVRVRETELLEATFVPADELRRLAADPAVDLESWSRFLAARLDELLD